MRGLRVGRRQRRGKSGRRAKFYTSSKSLLIRALAVIPIFATFMNTAPELRSWQIVLMACCTGLIVANIYYCQPLIVLISREFGVAESRAGVITFLTQLGYATGLLFLVPLGDKLERKKQILVTAGISVLALIVSAYSGSLAVLELAAFFTGATSIVPQLILPLSAALAPPEKRGKVIGTVMSGLLVGILLSRTLSGFVGDWLGWRAMFGMAAGITALLLIVIYFTFPSSKPQFSGTYASLMRSLLTYFRSYRLVREASFINALAFASFGMFWTTMVLHFAGDPFHYSSEKIGLFGLAAAAGALAAPLVGGRADRSSPRVTIGYGIAMVLASFVLFYFVRSSVAGMIIGIIVLDLGLQCIHVSNQSRMYALLPEARNRINTVFMTLSFLGTSLGSALGLAMWSLGGWSAVCISGVALLLVAVAVFRKGRD